MKLLLSFGGLLLALVLFFLFNVVCNTTLRSSRIDLTSNGLYTLSKGTTNQLAKLNDPVKLKFYFSKKLATDAGANVSYADRVRELLEEFVAHSSGKLTLEVFDPEPFSEQEDRAMGYGLQGLPVNAGGEKLYFGLAGTSTTDQEDVIPFFQQEKEESLEYDITKLVYNLSNPKKKVVGLITKLPLEGDMMERMRNPRAQPEEWYILEQIRSQFELRTVSDGVDKIEDGIDVLLVVHPQQLAEQTLYAIDQFTLGGGKVLVFCDPQCEEQQVRQDPNNPLQGMMADKSSTLGALFDAWGIEMKPDEIAGDRDCALRVGTGGGQSAELLVWLGLSKDKGNFATTDFVTAELNSVNIISPGILKKKDGATTEVTPLLETTRQSQRVQKSAIQFGPDPTKLMQSFHSGDEKLMLAARISGPVKTAFPNGNPKKDEPPKEGAPPPAPALAESNGPINVIVVADADMLADKFWVRVQNFLGIQKIAMAMADNGTFLMNALDNLSGSNDLISLRSRGKYQRPFDTVVALQKDAEQRSGARQKELEDKLRDTENKINEMQRGKESTGASAMILTDEQRQELENWEQEKLKARTELRRVKHDLLKDVESLGSRVTLLNIFGLPVAVTAFAFFFLMSRANRRRN